MMRPPAISLDAGKARNQTEKSSLKTVTANPCTIGKKTRLIASSKANHKCLKGDRLEHGSI
jgi:hypothetical protein